MSKQYSDENGDDDDDDDDHQDKEDDDDDGKNKTKRKFKQELQKAGIIGLGFAGIVAGFFALAWQTTVYLIRLFFAFLGVLWGMIVAVAALSWYVVAFMLIAIVGLYIQANQAPLISAASAVGGVADEVWNVGVNTAVKDFLIGINVVCEIYNVFVDFILLLIRLFYDAIKAIVKAIEDKRNANRLFPNGETHEKKRGIGIGSVIGSLINWVTDIFTFGVNIVTTFVHFIIHTLSKVSGSDVTDFIEYGLGLVVNGMGLGCLTNSEGLLDLGNIIGNLFNCAGLGDVWKCVSNFEKCIENGAGSFLGNGVKHIISKVLPLNPFRQDFHETSSENFFWNGDDALLSGEGKDENLHRHHAGRYNSSFPPTANLEEQIYQIQTFLNALVSYFMNETVVLFPVSYSTRNERETNKDHLGDHGAAPYQPNDESKEDMARLERGRSQKMQRLLETLDKIVSMRRSQAQTPNATANLSSTTDALPFNNGTRSDNKTADQASYLLEAFFYLINISKEEFETTKTRLLANVSMTERIHHHHLQEEEEEEEEDEEDEEEEDVLPSSDLTLQTQQDSERETRQKESSNEASLETNATASNAATATTTITIAPYNKEAILATMILLNETLSVINFVLIPRMNSIIKEEASKPMTQSLTQKRQCQASQKRSQKKSFKEEALEKTNIASAMHAFVSTIFNVYYPKKLALDARIKEVFAFEDKAYLEAKRSNQIDRLGRLVVPFQEAFNQQDDCFIEATTTTNTTNTTHPLNQTIDRIWKPPVFPLNKSNEKKRRHQQQQQQQNAYHHHHQEEEEEEEETSYLSIWIQKLKHKLRCDYEFALLRLFGRNRRTKDGLFETVRLEESESFLKENIEEARQTLIEFGSPQHMIDSAERDILWGRIDNPEMTKMIKKTKNVLSKFVSATPPQQQQQQQLNETMMMRMRKRLPGGLGGGLGGVGGAGGGLGGAVGGEIGGVLKGFAKFVKNPLKALGETLLQHPSSSIDKIAPFLSSGTGQVVVGRYFDIFTPLFTNIFVEPITAFFTSDFLAGFGDSLLDATKDTAELALAEIFRYLLCQVWRIFVQLLGLIPEVGMVFRYIPPQILEFLGPCPPPPAIENNRLVLKPWDYLDQAAFECSESPCTTPSDCAANSPCRCGHAFIWDSLLFSTGTDLHCPDHSGTCVCWPKLECQGELPESTWQKDIEELLTCSTVEGYVTTEVVDYFEPNPIVLVGNLINNALVGGRFIIHVIAYGIVVPKQLLIVPFLLLFISPSKALVMAAVFWAINKYMPILAHAFDTTIVVVASNIADHGFWPLSVIGQFVMNVIHYPGWSASNPVGSLSGIEWSCFFVNLPSIVLGFCILYFIASFFAYVLIRGVVTLTLSYVYGVVLAVSMLAIRLIRTLSTFFITARSKSSRSSRSSTSSSSSAASSSLSSSSFIGSRLNDHEDVEKGQDLIVFDDSFRPQSQHSGIENARFGFLCGISFNV